MGKTYKDSKTFNPSDKPKNKKSQKNVRDKIKLTKIEDNETDN